MRLLPLAILGLCSSILLADEAAELARHLPGSANTIAIVRVAEIFGTERAQAEGWAETQQERFLSGTAVIPPWVETLVVGSLVHPAVPEEVWSAALVRLPEEVTFESIAQQEGTAVEQLAGVPAVRGRRDSYLIQPVPDMLAAYRPAHRLETARWVRSIVEDQPAAISPYLREAVGTAGHVVLAIDLRDLLDAQRVEQHLREDERFASHGRLVERLVPLLAGLRGVTFSTTIGDSNQATVTIDFSAEVGPSSLTAKSLFVSVLDDLGAAIDEFATAQVSSEGRTVTLSCPLSDESLRRILSLIVTPSTPYRAPQTTAGHAPGVKPPSPGKGFDPASATRKYVAAVNEMIDDLRRANRRAKDYARTAAWHDNFARRVLELPTEGVRREALNYGQSMASKFRALGASLRGQGVEVNAQQKTLTYDVDYKPGWAAVNVWGGVGYREPAYNVSSNLREIRREQAAAVSAGAKEREQIWQFINDERAAITQALDVEASPGR